ncbi:hypothetical protein ACFL1N_16685, partial [Thermodesulfobacteriota bacterium]
MNYKKEMEKAKDFLNKKDYVFCTIQCGKILETAIKYLYFHYLETTSKNERMRTLKIQRELTKTPSERSYEDFTLGKIVTLFEKANIISRIIPHDGTKPNRRAQINLWDLVDIRNRAIHSNETDKDGISEEHAHVMYGNVVRIVNSPEIKQYMKTYKEKGTCSNCKEQYIADDDFMCKSCGESFCNSCLSDDNELCVKCKAKESLKKNVKKIITRSTTPPEFKMNKFTSIPFDSDRREALRNIYAVLYFMNRGYDFVHAVKQSLKHFPNIKNYETIADACARRFAGSVGKFKIWFETGVMLEKLGSKFSFSTNDYRIFRDLLTKKEKVSSPVDSNKYIAEVTPNKKRIYVRKTSPRMSQQFVTAGQFR